MKVQLKDRTIELPDKIYLDQLIHLDLSKLDKLDKIDTSDLSQINELVAWFLQFFKALGVEERFTLNDFVIMKDSGDLQMWMSNLISGFRPSK